MLKPGHYDMIELNNLALHMEIINPWRKEGDRNLSELAGFFHPKTVAVIGASRSPGKIGNAIVKNLLLNLYSGKVFPVNPKETEIEGLPCYQKVGNVPEPVDQAIISVPAEKVLAAAEECGRSGVKFLTVISAGFKETGKQGLELERNLVEICRQYGIRMLGPNCVGFMDTYVPINASFAAGFPLKGEIAFISQSGAMVLAILDWSHTVGLGFSKFISLGNKADLTEAHFIEDAADDPYTRVILCYIEDVESGRHFLEVASRAARKKPVIILKSGTSQAGARAATSHTGALAGSDLAYETAFRQCGLIRVRSMSELFDLAIAFANQPIPPEGKVAIVTNSGGPGIVATDAVELKHLKMARFSKETISALRGHLPAEANIYNPVDVLGDAGPDRYHFALSSILRDENVDSAVVLVCPTAVNEPLETARAMISIRKAHPDKPLLAAFMGGAKLAEGTRLLTKAGIPCFTFPEPAIAAISGLVEYARIKSRPVNPEVPYLNNVDKETVHLIFSGVKKDNRLVLLGSEAAKIATAYGIQAAPTILAAQPEEAVKIAEQVGYPVVLKIASPKILHKTDIGGVKVGLDTPDKIRAGFIEIIENAHRYMPHAAVYGVEVQKMMPKGIELIVGMNRDIQFGPLIAFGLGGIYVNLLKDVSFRLAYRLTKQEIKDMLTETKAYTLLRGYRGEKPADINAIIEAIGRVAGLATDFPEIAEMDVNPLFAYNNGVYALDVKITIA